MASDRQNVSSGAVWEPVVGYSRAVRVGSHVFVAGTVGEGESSYEQAFDALRRIEKALGEAGARLTDVVRTRMFVTDISHWQEIGKAHGEFFAEVRPATSMVEVRRLIGPQYVVEIEADAVLSE